MKSDNNESTETSQTQSGLSQSKSSSQYSSSISSQGLSGTGSDLMITNTNESTDCSSQSQHIPSELHSVSFHLQSGSSQSQPGGSSQSQSGSLQSQSGSSQSQSGSSQSQSGSSQSQSGSSQPQSGSSQSQASSGARSDETLVMVPVSDEEETDELEKTGAWGWLSPMQPMFRKFDLINPVNRFGRYERCDYTFEHDCGFVPIESISNKHFTIYKVKDKGNNPDSVYIKDKSSNGTYVNGVAIGTDKKCILTNNDVISLVHPSNQAFIYIDVQQLRQQRKTLPVEFRKKYILEPVMLGRGAFGEVHRATIRGTSKKVAVKIVKKDIPNNTRADYRYEVSILKELNHPCIVKLEDCYYEDEKLIYMVIEYVAGGDLFCWIQEHGSMKEDKAKVWCLQLLKAIVYLHKMNITHRDLKPENVLLTDRSEDCLLKVTDFGVSRIFSSKSLSSEVGTARYMAPEMIEHEHERNSYTHQVDCWSFGCILYMCFDGMYPFRSKSPDLLKLEIKTGQYSMEGDSWMVISEEGKDLVRKMLTVNADKRLSALEALSHPWLVNSPMILRKVDTLLNMKRSSSKRYHQSAKRQKMNE